jgi:hypothetical protein
MSNLDETKYNFASTAAQDGTCSNGFETGFPPTTAPLQSKVIYDQCLRDQADSHTRKARFGTTPGSGNQNDTGFSREMLRMLTST